MGFIVFIFFWGLLKSVRCLHCMKSSSVPSLPGVSEVSHVPGEAKQLSIAVGFAEAERPSISFLNGQGQGMERDGLWLVAWGFVS